jgi:hypothetical protein
MLLLKTIEIFIMLTIGGTAVIGIFLFLMGLVQKANKKAALNGRPF